jgi:hypothetical protein
MSDLQHLIDGETFIELKTGERIDPKRVSFDFGEIGPPPFEITDQASAMRAACWYEFEKQKRERK